ncbi:MAG: hypothetical protein SFU21_04600 [Flavihumibacter sp.]|nr:hypothetical protein [Flavihumibacter sp.]
MTTFLLIAAVVLCAAIEAYRIHHAPAGTNNVRKLYRVLIAVLIYGLVNTWHLLKGLPLIATDVPRIIEYILWQWLLFDPLLNLLRGKSIALKSNTTNSKKDKALRNIGFWQERLIAAALLIVYFLIIYLW